MRDIMAEMIFASTIGKSHMTENNRGWDNPSKKGLMFVSRIQELLKGKERIQALRVVFIEKFVSGGSPRKTILNSEEK